MPNRDDENELYDAALGPRRPRTRRPVCEWDDPTWIAVEVTEWFKSLEHDDGQVVLPAAVEVDDPAWVNMKQAGRLLPVSEHTLRAAIVRGTVQIRFHRRGGWKLWREDVLALAEFMLANPEWRPLADHWAPGL